MIYDTNILIDAIRKDLVVPNRLILSIAVVGELEAFALKADWGVQKVNRMNRLFTICPIADITLPITKLYAQIDAYSQGNYS